MKAFKIIYTSIALTVTAASCSEKFTKYEVDPNHATAVPPSLVLTGILADVNTDGPWSDVSRWNQFDVCNYNYYGDQRYDWTGASLNYSTLKNIVKMEEEAANAGLPEVNEYTAIGKFLRAFFYYRMTNLTGDIPLSEALAGIEIPQPVYDSQEIVFKQILQWLDEANTDMAFVISNSGDGKIDGDFYFSTKSAWQRVINAFHLRVLIALSKKESDASLNIQSSFASIVNNPSQYPLFEDAADNLQYIYSTYNKYPSNPDNLGFDATRYNMAATYLNNLVTLNDPRAFVTAEPATAQLTAGKSVTDITAYNGASSGEDLAEMSSKMSDVNNAEYSVRSRQRYYSSYTAEPGIIIGYAEMCFNIAEAVNRGWLTGNAEDWYIKGIKSSLSFYGIPVDAAGSFTKIYPYNSSDAVTYNIDFNFADYYAQPSVKYAGNTENGLEQILLQKYLAFFQNSGWEAYYNYRRTGMPAFLTGTGTGNSGRIPKRFQYPATEQTTNETNWSNAVSSQFGGTADDINAEMWLIK